MHQNSLGDEGACSPPSRILSQARTFVNTLKTRPGDGVLDKRPRYSVVIALHRPNILTKNEARLHDRLLLMIENDSMVNHIDLNRFVLGKIEDRTRRIAAEGRCAFEERAQPLLVRVQHFQCVLHQSPHVALRPEGYRPPNPMQLELRYELQCTSVRLSAS